MPADLSPDLAATMDAEDRQAWEDAQAEAVTQDLREAGLL